MWSIYNKELAEFFSSLAAYVAGLTFLTLTALLLWVLPGDGNVLDTGQANMGSLFRFAPWLYLILLPSITMRMLAEERREGTLEWLLCKPLTPAQVIFGKFLAAISLVVLTLLPTLIHVVFIYHLGEPKGSIDLGATIGSYFGLVLLSASYAAFGIFCSALTRNAVAAFVLAALLSLLIYQGFDELSRLSLFKGAEYAIASIGAKEHYLSLRRGVIDTRDIAYFVIVVTIALISATQVLHHKRK